LGEEDVERAKSGSNNLGNLFEDFEFSRSLVGVSVVVGIVKFALLGLGGESVSGVRELLLVLSKSSSLVGEGGGDFSKFGSISGKLSFGLRSEVSDGDHQVIEVNLGLDLSFDIFVEESGEINLELFEETDALGKGGTVKRRSDFNEGGDWVGGTEFGELNEDLRSGVWGDGSKFWDDDLKSVKDELGLFLSGEEIFGVLSSLGSSGSFLLVEHNKGGFTGGDVLDKSSLSRSERFDSLGGFLDLVGGVRHSSVIVGNLIGAFTHFGGVSVISSLLLGSKVVHHVSDEVGNVLHWGVRFHLESNGVEEVFTEIVRIDSVESGSQLLVGTEEGRFGESTDDDESDDESSFHCCFLK
jgi:hypothetical protein